MAEAEVEVEFREIGDSSLTRKQTRARLQGCFNHFRRERNNSFALLFTASIIKSAL